MVSTHTFVISYLDGWTRISTYYGEHWHICYILPWRTHWSWQLLDRILNSIKATLNDRNLTDKQRRFKAKCLEGQTSHRIFLEWRSRQVLLKECTQKSIISVKISGVCGCIPETCTQNGSLSSSEPFSLHWLRGSRSSGDKTWHSRQFMWKDYFIIAALLLSLQGR